MAVQLFRAGTGQECEVGTFNEYSYLHLLDQGWHYTREECYAEENDQKKNGAEEKTEKETDEAKKRLLIDDGIRAEAKAAGIDSYWRKTIANLEKELMELSDEHRIEG